MLGFSFRVGNTPALAQELIHLLSSSRCLESLVTSDNCWPEGPCVGWHRDRQVASPRTRVAEFKEP